MAPMVLWHDVEYHMSCALPIVLYQNSTAGHTARAQARKRARERARTHAPTGTLRPALCVMKDISYHNISYCA